MTHSPRPPQPSPPPPHAVESVLEQIAQLGQTGRLAEAAAQCQQLLQDYPDTARAWDMLGLIALQQGKLSEALSHLDRSIALDPHQSSFHDHAGVVQCGLGNFEIGVGCYQRALALNPQVVHIRYNLGLALQKLGRSDEALQTYLQVIAQQPQHPVAHYQIGNLLQQQQQFAAAIDHYQQAIQQQPQYAEAWYNLGVALQQIGEQPQALNAYQQALALNPDYAEALNGLGTLLDKQEKAAEALHCYQRALALQPDYLHALINLGSLQIRLDRLTQAEATYHQVLQLAPQSMPALDNLIKIQLQRCHWADLAERTTQLRTIAQDRLTQGLACNISPLNSLFLPCSAAEQQAIARSHAEGIAQRMGDRGGKAEGRRQKAEGRGGEGETERTQSFLRNASRTVLSPQSSKIRLGYVSGDFRYHAVGHLIFRLFELHDRQQFEVFAYSLGPDDGSGERQKLMADCDCFRDIRHLTPRAAAQQIEQDQIQILIDLAGYTDYTCPEIFALRPAPIQVNYLGYPGTLGSDAIDYIITDAIITPAELAAFLTETCIYLPDSYQLNSYQQFEAEGRRQRAEGRRQELQALHQPKTQNPEFKTLPQSFLRNASRTVLSPSCGTLREQSSVLSPSFGTLREQSSPFHSPFTFCCFNKSQKIEPQIFAAWMRILQQVPDSVLWLLSDRPETEANLKQAAQMQGIDPDRICFAPRVLKAEHLARQAQADLFLDTLHYNAHVTASDALWAGVPVITVLGETFASRVGASLLTAIGLPELITPDLEAYERLAVHLATHAEALQQLKAKLADHRTQFPLFDTSRTLRHLETGYRSIWQRYQSGQQPEPVWVGTEGRGQRAEGRRQRAEGRGQKAERSQELGARSQELQTLNPAKIQSPSSVHCSAEASYSPQSSVLSPQSSSLIPQSSSLIPQSSSLIPHPSPPDDTITCTIDDGFGSWLSQSQGSLMITTYQAGKVILVGWNGQQVTLLPREFARPMGIAVEGDRLALATQAEILLFANATALVPGYLPDRPTRYDALYLPRASYFTGDLQIHDLAFGAEGVWMVNTRFSCLAQLSPEFNFVPRWQPPFISELTPDDRCHLNGLAIVAGKPGYVTALGATNRQRGWSATRATAGILIEVETGETRLQGLAMPHSPRWHQGFLWLLNSGRGELWRVDPATWQHQVVCTLPGFGRGLRLVGNYALVGLSQVREQQTFGGLPIQEQFDRLRCGVAIVDLQRGEPVGWLEFTGGCRELYDLAFLPTSQHPTLLSSDQAAVRQAITTPEFAYWLRPLTL